MEFNYFRISVLAFCCDCLSNHDDANEYVKSVLNGGEKWKRKMDLQY